MLGKLQEASQYMAKLKRKQKEKTYYGRYSPDSVNTDWSCDHFGYDDYRVESHRPDSVNTDWSYTSRNSIDGSSKDCYEELREAIMEGLTKQNLLPKSCNEGKMVLKEDKAYFDRRTKLDLSLECLSSTSSSPTSMFHSREFDTSDNSFQWSFEEKAKGSSTFTTTRNYGTPFSDMDLPKPRVPQFSVEKVDSPRRTLEELTQTMHFKGLVTSPSRDRSDHQKQLSKVFDRIKNLRGDSPPIVIIKPLQVSGSLEEDVQKQKKFISQEFDIKEIIMNLKMNEEVPSRTDDGVIRLMEKISSTKMKASVQEKAEVQVKEVVDDKAYIVKKSNTNKIVSTCCKKPDTESTVLQDQISQLKAKPENLVEMQLKYEAIQINPCYDDDEDDLAVIKHTTSEEVPVADEINNTCRNLDYGNKRDKIGDQKANYVTRNLLFNNPLFINKVEELFYTNAHDQPNTSQQDNIISVDTTTPSPLLDCAKELLQNKSLIQSTKSAHQFTNVVTNKSKMFVFLDQLVGEVCDGFEDLKGYHKKLNGETFAQNTLPKVLHMDLWCKGVVNGGWDLGWKCGFTADEIEQIVVNIEHEILNEIIGNTVEDMMMLS